MNEPTPKSGEAISFRGEILKGYENLETPNRNSQPPARVNKNKHVLRPAIAITSQALTKHQATLMISTLQALVYASSGVSMSCVSIMICVFARNPFRPELTSLAPYRSPIPSHACTQARTNTYSHTQIYILHPSTYRGCSSKGLAHLQTNF